MVIVIRQDIIMMAMPIAIPTRGIGITIATATTPPATGRSAADTASVAEPG